MTDFKPGDLAMVKCSDGEMRRAFCIETLDGRQWRFADAKTRWVDDSTARRIPAVDPGNQRQVDALRDCILANGYEFSGLRAANLALALQQYREPAEMEEPTDLFAMVVDEDGQRWARTFTSGAAPWRPMKFTQVNGWHLTPGYDDVSAWTGIKNPKPVE